MDILRGQVKTGTGNHEQYPCSVLGSTHSSATSFTSSCASVIYRADTLTFKFLILWRRNYPVSIVIAFDYIFQTIFRLKLSNYQRAVFPPPPPPTPRQNTQKERECKRHRSVTVVNITISSKFNKFWYQTKFSKTTAK